MDLLGLAFGDVVLVTGVEPLPNSTATKVYVGSRWHGLYVIVDEPVRLGPQHTLIARPRPDQVFSDAEDEASLGHA